jgi:soluble lytic murein transglycosylase-like protein
MRLSPSFETSRKQGVRGILKLLRPAPLVLLLSGFVVSTTPQAATTERPDSEMRDLLLESISASDSFNDRFEAEVWLSDMSNRLKRKVKNPEERFLILKTAHYEATRADLPPELVLALIDIESNFDRFAISYAGARGLMQVMPFWLDEIGRPGDDLFDIHTNLRFGCTILKLYLDRERGNRTRALARYNGSVGKMWYPQRVYKALGKRWYRQ